MKLFVTVVFTLFIIGCIEVKTPQPECLCTCKCDVPKPDLFLDMSKTETVEP